MNIFASLKLINDMKNLSLGSLMRILSAFIFLLSMGHRTKRILRIERKEYQTY